MGRCSRPGILAYHEQNIVMFDVPPPLQSKGMREYKKTWDLFFKYHKPSSSYKRSISRSLQLQLAKMSPSLSQSRDAEPARNQMGFSYD
jgi:ketosteroid isomerase-like protein